MVGSLKLGSPGSESTLGNDRSPVGRRVQTRKKDEQAEGWLDSGPEPMFDRRAT